MAHEIESMMFVGDTPWHGLGTRFVEPPSLDEAMVASGLDWEVTTNPVFDHWRDEIPDKYSITRKVKVEGGILGEEKLVHLGIVGGRYEPLQNVDAFRWFEPFINEGLASIETAASLRHGQRVFVLAKINGAPDIIGGDDEVSRYILLSNSHDGKQSVRAGFTPIRVVCSNTLAWAIRDKSSSLIRVNHSKSVYDNLEALRETMNLASQQFEANAEQFRWLASIPITSGDLKEYIKVSLELQTSLKANGDERENHALNKVISLFESGRGSDLATAKGTYWGAYNAVNEYLGYFQGKGQETRVNSLFFGRGNLFNKKALNTAMAMSA